MATQKRFTNPQFRDAVKQLLPLYGHRKLAEVLRQKGVCFYDAYVAIFDCNPTDSLMNLRYGELRGGLSANIGTLMTSR